MSRIRKVACRHKNCVQFLLWPQILHTFSPRQTAKPLYWVIPCHPRHANAMATETVTVTATITMPMPTTAQQQQQQEQHTRDVPCGGGGGDNVGGWGGERNGNGRGGSDGGSRRGGRWARQVAAVQCIYFSPIFFSPSPPPPPKAEAMLRSLAVRHIPGVSSL